MNLTSSSFNWPEVIEEPTFQKAIDRLGSQYQRLQNEVHEAITWKLGRDPQAGKLFDDRFGHRIYTTPPIGSLPSFWILYRYDEKEGKVYLLSLAPAEVELYGEAEEIK